MTPSPSFRDPAGQLLFHDGRVFRLVNSSAVEEIREFLQSDAAQSLQQHGLLVRTVETFQKDVAVADGQVVLEHERIPFPSYPYEWAPEMLHAAGGLTLELCEAALANGFGLKDGTPYNVLFRGPQPVFVDVLSFEKRDPGDPIWLPEAQFTRTFLLPLLAYRSLGMSMEATLSSREGLEPEMMHRWLRPVSRFRPPALSLVSVPTWLGRLRANGESHYRRILLRDADKAQFIVRNTIKRLRRALDSLQPQPSQDSTWSGYMARNSYSPEQMGLKEQFVHNAVREFRASRVLDVGCNAGHFSAVCARAGAEVVGIDIDPVVVGAAWRKARDERLPVLPLVVNIAHPTPSRGWRNEECPSFLDRAEGFFDGAIMLAILHHLVITERAPLLRIVSLIADLVSTFAVIEYVGPQDPMFRKLLRGRDHLHADFNQESFETGVRSRFEIVRRCDIDGLDRALYLLRKVQ